MQLVAASPPAAASAGASDGPGGEDPLTAGVSAYLQLGYLTPGQPHTRTGTGDSMCRGGAAGL